MRALAASCLFCIAALASPARACPESGEGVLVEPASLRVRGDIRFDLYGPSLDPASHPAIDAVARRLRECPDLQVEIQVHTDTRRTQRFNARASRAIAALIRERLVAQGVRPEQVAACGYGESRPPAGREPWSPANNRVEWVRVRSAAAHACAPAERP
jgi:outer membrane protein OmpA-like peptidoglycan-associated protein